jgi:hypothetical protein
VRLIACFALVIGLAIVDDAGAVESAFIQATLNLDGRGRMIVNSQSNPAGETWSWQDCALDGSACVPFATGREAGTAGAKPDTVLVATANDGPMARSPVWHGVASAAKLPAVSGDVRANALVTPVAGTWSGGWDGDYDRMQLAACINADGSSCTPLTDPPSYQGCPHEAAVIDPAFTGRYLRVADHRLAAGTVFLDLALSSPYGSPVWEQNPTASVALVGRIAAARGPRTSSCGPPPLGQSMPPTSTNPPLTNPPSRPRTGPPLRSSAKLSRHGVAKVHCSARCSIVLRARRGGDRVHVGRVLRGAGSATIQLPKRALQRLGRGRATFSVEVDGTELVRRTVRVE